MPRSRRLDKTLSDYMVLAISPALIIAMVSSLMFFLVEVMMGQQGGEGRATWVVFCYSVAIVLIARISMEEGVERAGLFAAPLAVAMLLVLGRFGFSLPPTALVLGVVWWAAHQLTWDSTFIDERVDASGQGLLEVVGLDADAANASQDEKRQGSTANADESPSSSPWQRFQEWRKRRREKHAPGLWAVYFSLAALPMFGIGQAFMPAGAVEQRQYVFKLVLVYLASGLGLLMTTSFLGLRRYLRQRKLEMPAAIAGTWLAVGGGLAVALLVAAMIIPRPNAEYALSSFSGSDGSPRPNANRFSPLKDNPGQGEGAASNESRPDQPTTGDNGANPSQGKPGNGGQPGQSGSGDQGSGGSGNSGGDKGQQGTEGQQGQKGQKGEQPAAGDKEGGQPPGKSPTGDSSAGQQPMGQSPPQQPNSDQNPPGEKPAANSSPQQPPGQPPADQPPTANPPNSSPGNTQNPSASNNPPPPPSQPQQPQQPAAPRFQLPDLGSGLTMLFRWALNIGLAVAAFYFIRMYWTTIRQYFREMLAALRALWNRLFGGEGPEVEATAATEGDHRPRHPFAAYANPFASGMASRYSPNQLVCYTFEALQAWAEEHGSPRRPHSTPLEFAAELGRSHPHLAAEAKELAKLTSHVVYGGAKLTPDASLATISQLWGKLGVSEMPSAERLSAFSNQHKR